MAFLLVIQMLMWGVLGFFGTILNEVCLAPLLLIMGVVMGGISISLWTLVKQTTGQEIMGLTTGLLNPFPMLGMAVFQSWTGAFLDSVSTTRGLHSPEAYESMFFRFFMVAVACLLLYSRLGKAKSIRDLEA